MTRNPETLEYVMAYMNILIPLDGSPDSVFACEIAVNITCSDPTERVFHLVHCAEPIPSLIGGENRAELREDQRNEADQIFAQAENFFKERGYAVRVCLREGSPGIEIVRAAEETGSEVIIMGTRGLGRLESLFLGSVSRDVLKHSKVPVLLANHPHPYQ